jgi:hypothetical protein
MSFLSEIRGFNFVSLEKAPETVIKQHLPSLQVKKVGEEGEETDAGQEVCDWVKHAKTIDAQINQPKVSFSDFVAPKKLGNLL